MGTGCEPACAISTRAAFYPGATLFGGDAGCGRFRKKRENLFR
jgi:hypothetical protein